MKENKYIFWILALALMLTACAVPESAPGATVPGEVVVETVPLETVPPDPVAVEITMENWEEYFELRSTEQVYLNDSCSVINRVFGYGVFLKEEYADRLAEGSDVSFELEYDVVWRRVMGDLTGDSYLIQSPMAEINRQTQTAGLTDFRGKTDISEESDFYNSIAVEFEFDSEFGA